MCIVSLDSSSLVAEAASEICKGVAKGSMAFTAENIAWGLARFA